MIDSGMFEEKYVIEWEDVTVKTWTHATFFFKARKEEEDTFTAVVRSTAKREVFILSVPVKCIKLFPQHLPTVPMK